MEKPRVIKNNDKLYFRAIVVLGVILIALGVMYFIERNENKRYITEITSEKLSLESELMGLSVEYDSLKTTNDTLNTQLVGEKQKIDELLKRMQTFRNNSYYEISKYKKELGSLRQVLRSYIVQIDSLNTKNKELTAENSRVKKQIDWVKDKNKVLEETQESMKDIINKASALIAQNLEAYPVNRKGRQQRKISKTKKIKVSFTLSKNVTSPVGNKTIYARISTPNNKILINPNGLNFKFESSNLDYSAKRDIDYEGEQIDVSLFWTNDNTLVKGKYTVDIFTDGFHIGTCNFNLK